MILYKINQIRAYTDVTTAETRQRLVEFYKELYRTQL